MYDIHSPLTRGAPHGEARIPYRSDFNPLPSCEGRPIFYTNQFGVSIISIHSPHARGDLQAASGCIRYQISIHSPHTRGDCPSPCRPSRRTYFNPLPSREGRHLGIDIDKAVREFQSTPLMRGETFTGRADRVRRAISIHSPHTRGDAVRTAWPPRSPHFNPLPSCEGRRALTAEDRAKQIFQSAPLMRGETARRGDQKPDEQISTRFPHARGDPCSGLACQGGTNFNPLPSYEGRLTCATLDNMIL